jgi:hypothetical protein
MGVLPMSLSDDQLARATAALDAWYSNPGGDPYRAPGVTWSSDELQRMHTALEAPSVAAALEALGAGPGTEFSTRDQDEQNLALITELRLRRRAAQRPALDPEPLPARRTAGTGRRESLPR